MKFLLGERLDFDWKVVTITIVSTLLLMVDYYHRLTPHKYWDRLILYLVLPLIIIVLLFRENPRDFGFALGDWKAQSVRRAPPDNPGTISRRTPFCVSSSKCVLADSMRALVEGQSNARRVRQAFWGSTIDQ